MMRLCAILLVLGLAARTAHAGYCDDDSARLMIVELEKFGDGKAKEPDIWGLCIEQAIEPSPALTKRFVAACEKVIAKHGTNASCVRWSVEVGAKKLGSLDLFDATSKLFGLDPWKPGDIGVTLFAKLDDPRALPLVTAAWTTAAASKKVRSAKSNDQYLWTVWRHAAIRLFASQGRTDDITFLREQAAATRDRGVKRAIGKAIAAIEKRAAKP